MSKRYFATRPIHDAGTILEGGEAHHLLHVMRAGIGDSVVLFDGSGREFDAEITRLGRSDVELRVNSARFVDRESPTHLELCVAFPKGDRQKWLVEKCVELGVAQLTPMITERSVAQPGDKALERIRRWVIEASKQCGRNRLMRIGAVTELQALVENSDSSDTTRWIAHPHGDAQRSVIDDVPANVHALIGPEGGFTDTEVELARDNAWQPLSIGPRILRTETAAMVVAAMCQTADGPKPD